MTDRKKLLKEEFIIVLQRKAHATPTEPLGKPQGMPEGRRNEGKVCTRAFIVIFGGRMIFTRLCTIGVVPNCQVPLSGETVFWTAEPDKRRPMAGMGSGLVALHVKDILFQVFTSSRN